MLNNENLPAFNVRRDGAVSTFVVDLPEADPAAAHAAILLHHHLLLHEVVRPVVYECRMRSTIVQKLEHSLQKKSPVWNTARVAEVPPHARPGGGRRSWAVDRLVPALGGVIPALLRRRRRLIVALLGEGNERLQGGTEGICQGSSILSHLPCIEPCRCT